MTILNSLAFVSLLTSLIVAKYLSALRNTREVLRSSPSFLLRKISSAPCDVVQPACKGLALPSASWLTFRRTFATWADQNGVSAKQRGELMGNSAEVNAMVYTQVMDHALRSGIQRISDELFSNCSISSESVN